MEAVSDLDVKAGTVYWVMKQCGEQAWVINAWGQKGVLERVLELEQVEFML